MRVIVCGSAPRRRTGRPGWTDRGILDTRLDELRAALACSGESLVVVEGEAPGADQMAREWAGSRRVPVERFPADWSKGPGAGPRRNQQMLDSGPVGMVVAFSLYWLPTGGTLDMCDRAAGADIPVFVVTPDNDRREFPRAVAA